MFNCIKTNASPLDDHSCKYGCGNYTVLHNKAFTLTLSHTFQAQTYMMGASSKTF